MQTEDLEQHIYEIIVDLCAVLYNNGYRMVPMGAMMRLIGVDDEEAALHDEEMFHLDEDFERIMSQRIEDSEDLSEDADLVRPPDATLH